METQEATEQQQVAQTNGKPVAVVTAHEITRR